MKPQEHISPESWRHEDAALRRALQQRNEALPQLPEGFADQIQTQLSESVQALQSESVQTQLPAQPAADSSKHSHRLLLWPMIAAAVVIIALLINLPSLTHEQFVTEQLAKVMRPVSVHVGSDFRFGAGGAGTAQSLAELGQREGFEVFAHDLVCRDGRAISSTRVRDLVEKGNLDGARELLCRSHYLQGRMVAVEDDGGGVCQLDVRDSVPPNGKYAAYAVTGDYAIPSMVLLRRQGPRELPGAVIVPLCDTGLRPGSPVRIVFVKRLSALRGDNSQESKILRVQDCVNWVNDYLGASRVEVGR